MLVQRPRPRLGGQPIEVLRPEGGATSTDHILLGSHQQPQSPQTRLPLTRGNQEPLEFVAVVPKNTKDAFHLCNRLGVWSW